MMQGKTTPQAGADSWFDYSKIDANEALTHIPLESVPGTSAQNIKQYFALLLRFSFFRCNTTLDTKKKLREAVIDLK